MNGNEISWQKWKLRITFTPREGLVLHNLTFDGRQTFYRLAVEEMAVPYFDPRPPASRRCAFDFGDCGGGKTANELELGCDCLGTIKYFGGSLVDPKGNVYTKKNTICVHEQDDGIAMKHTNYRTNVPIVQRRRILVIQTILTVGNYEYIFAWHLDQAAGIKLEIRATGIVSTTYLDPGKFNKYGTVVSPSVFAASHQHIFNVRIDPAVDGHENTVAYCDTIQSPGVLRTLMARLPTTRSTMSRSLPFWMLIFPRIVMSRFATKTRRTQSQATLLLTSCMPSPLPCSWLALALWSMTVPSLLHTPLGHQVQGPGVLPWWTFHQPVC